MIEVSNLSKSFGKVRALNGLTFKVEEGEIYALLGPNGAGKSTTLKILVGLLKPDSGCAKICGIDVRKRVEVLRIVGYIPEDPIIFPYLTAKEVLTYSAELRGLEDCEDRIEYLLQTFNLDPDKIVSSMSKGMVQKLCACMAILHEPRVLIMDEPMANMDPESQHIFKREVRKLNSTCLISSHQLEAVEKFCTRIGIIKDGRIVYEGHASEDLEEVFLRVVRCSSE